MLGKFQLDYIIHLFLCLSVVANCIAARGEQALRCSAILLNESQTCRNPGSIDAIIMLTEPGLEFSVLEVSSSPSDPDHTHYVGDRNKTAKNLKIILNFIRKKYPGDFEQFRKMKVYGIQIYSKFYLIKQNCGLAIRPYISRHVL